MGKYNNFNKPSSIKIDTKYKEAYYEPITQEKEEPANQSRDLFWNYLINVSIQNTVVQRRI